MAQEAAEVLALQRQKQVLGGVGLREDDLERHGPKVALVARELEQDLRGAPPANPDRPSAVLCRAVRPGREGFLHRTWFM